MTRILTLSILLVSLSIQPVWAQTYLVENFDLPFTGNPAAPPGWTQSRIRAVLTTNGERDWAQNQWTGSLWVFPAFGFRPPNAVSGNGVLFIDDVNLGGGTVAVTERRIESPIMNLSTSVSPYVRFFYYNRESAGLLMNLRVVISDDGGNTWKTLSHVLNGNHTNVNSWDRISIPIPPKYRRANVKIGFAITNRWASNNPYIDSLVVEEYVPSVVTSSTSGDWNNVNTWSSGVVPTSNDHVIISSGHTVTVSAAFGFGGIVSRCQDLTINGILNFGSNTSNNLHVQGDLTVNGTYNGTALARSIIVGGNVTFGFGSTANFITTSNNNNQGNANAVPLVTLNPNTNTLIFDNAKPVLFNNFGTLSSGSNRINNIIIMGSDTVSFQTDSVVVTNSISIRDGILQTNNFVVLGNAPTSGSTTHLILCRGRLLGELRWNNTNISTRNFGYHYSNTVSVEPFTQLQGSEFPTISSNRTVNNTLYLNTHNNISLTEHVRVLGNLTLIRGIINTTNSSYIWYSGTPSNLSSGVQPSLSSPPATHGSYINGPIRIDCQAITGNYNIPLGKGNAFNQSTIGPNCRRLLTISSIITPFAATNQMLIQPIGSQMSGTVNLPANSLLGAQGYRIQRLGTGDLATSATITVETSNTVFSTTDSLQGNINQLYVVQSANPTGPWTVRSAVAGSATPFVQNTYYTRTATSVGPLNTNGEYITWGSIAPFAVYNSNTVLRDTSSFSGGVPISNLRILRVNIITTGTVMRPQINQLVFRIRGSNIAPVSQAKIFYTGADTNFLTHTSYGSIVASPTDTMRFTQNRTLLPGNNFFWLVYDMNGASISGDSISADPIIAVVDGINRTLAVPSSRFRVSVAPLLFVSATSAHTTTAPIPRGSGQNPMLRIRVNMTTFGSAVQLTSLTATTAGSDNPFLDADSIQIWYTGSNPSFVNPVYFGGLASQSGTYTITGVQDLTNDSNFFWITYNVPTFATVSNVLDAGVTSMVIGGITRVPSITNPAGNRTISAVYCVSGALLSTDSDIGRVLLRNGIDTLLFNGNGCGTNRTSDTGTYTNNTALSNIFIPRGRNIQLSVCYSSSTNLAVNSGLAVYIDLNKNGTFETTEMVWTASALSNTTFTGSFQLPCNTPLGNTRMRIVLQEGVLLDEFGACGNYSYGETEDYTVTITEQIPMFTGATAIQQTGSAPAAATNVPILYVPVVINSSSCIRGTISRFSFRTTGTDSLSNISTAKLYRTTANQFNTTRLLASISNPDSAFQFVIVDTTQNDTNHYWLAYDIASAATGGNVLDAVLDSIRFQNVIQPIAAGNPSGNIIVTAPMNYISATAQHTDLQKVERASANNVLLRIPIVMSTSGAPVQLTQFNLSTGTTANPLANIDSIIVWTTGNTPSFNAPQFFGGVGKRSGNFSISGFRNLLNDTNYFWLTYHIASLANTTDSVDGVCQSMVIDGITRIPTDTSPVGNRKIRAAYCISGAQFADDGEIFNVTIGSLNNSSTCDSTGGPGSILNRYSNYTNKLAPVTIVAGKPLPFSVHTSTCGGNFQSALGIWIDINDDGDYVDAGETLHISPLFTYGPSMFRTGQLTLPCPNTEGLYRVRVALIETNSLPITSCQTYQYGETEEYLVQVVRETPVFQFATTQQLIDTAEAASRNRPILRIPVKANSNACIAGIVSQLRFQTTGTTLPSDITAAKIFKSASPAAPDTNRLLGTVANPSGAFTINIQDTLGFDTVYYWLTYDVALTAANNNFLDATFDSLLYNGNWHLPAQSNPAGNVRIFTFMKFISATAEHPVFTNPVQGTERVQILRIPISMSSIGQALILSQIQLSVAGTTNPLLNIDSIHVWTTGINPQWTNPQLFAQTGSQSGAFILSGSDTLEFGINYLWVTYRLKSTSIIGDTLDAQLLQLTIGAVNRIPLVTSPAGVLRIRPNYCTPVSLSGTASGRFISQVQVANMTYTGIGSTTAPFFTVFDTLRANLQQGYTYTLQITGGSLSGNTVAAWIDFNNDGTFSASEKLGQLNGLVAAPAVASFTFRLPLDVPLVDTRMRILLNDSSGTDLASCITSAQGETKDFMISVLAAPTPTVYVWNQSGGGSYQVAGNWTPSRIQPNANDKLVIQTGGTVTISNVPADLVSTFTVLNNTNVVLQSTNAVVLSIQDTLALTSGRISPNQHVRLRCGSNAFFNQVVKRGTVSGTGYVNGTLQHWIEGTGAYAFPIRWADTARHVSVTYTSAPTQQGIISAQFIAGQPSTAGLPLSDNSQILNRIAQNGRWVIQAEHGLSGGLANITLRADQFAGVQQLPLMSVLRRADSSSNWTATGTFVAATGTITSFIIGRNALSQWGEFGIAGNASSNPLPVEWVSVSAQNLHPNVLLTWTVNNEQSVSHYVIERSVSGTDFEAVHTIPALSANYIGLRTYTYTDREVWKNNATIYFYRIRQVDIDGAWEYSHVVTATHHMQTPTAQVNPNPFATYPALTLTPGVYGRIEITLTDMQGRSIIHLSHDCNGAGETIPLEMLTQLANGVYMLQINGSMQFNTKLIKTE